MRVSYFRKLPKLFRKYRSLPGSKVTDSLSFFFSGGESGATVRQLLRGNAGTSFVEFSGFLGGSWDLVSGVISKVTTVIITYNPN